ncbi:iron chelate uptake ABC transporter family permease subunit, partial [Bacillus sp. S1-R1J2-FB]|uniref:iron chelate uptake ABC transporter family permease subunit n=1 Tax=Bacillus sp. S1-R1J2-FB TaxID=1973494 RepID=UPI00111E4C18
IFLVLICYISIVLSTVLCRSISLISLSVTVATNLGLKTNRKSILGMLIVVIVACVSVSAVGSIGFVGLVIPHIDIKIVGVNYRLIIPMSSLLGAMLLFLADLWARTVIPTTELAIGIMVALLGVPFFPYLARKVWREL